jgi:hypothetical protein
MTNYPPLPPRWQRPFFWAAMPLFMLVVWLTFREW